MNVNDVADVETPSTWDAQLIRIFARQGELMLKYKDIERLPAPPVPLHHANGQRILKDFAWRVTEELAEAYEARTKHDAATSVAHCREELADALHFLVELLIFAGVTPAQCLELQPVFPPTWAPSGGDLELMYWNVIADLGVAMNFLRNKPWKQAQVPTDEGRFRDAIIKTFTTLVALFAAEGMTSEVIFAFYFKKSQVNAFRQRSQY